MEKIIRKDDPYTLDYFEETKIPALTKKNKNFIEGILRIDSNYRKDFDINEGPYNDFEPIEYLTNPNSKYCGSLAYWFDQMKNPIHGWNYEQCLAGAVISIDRTNSTHLEASINGREVIWNIIKRDCPTLDKLKEELKKGFTNNSQTCLIENMSVGMLSMGDNRGNRRNLSFASKFCSYASIELLNDDQFSKYDSVVANSLNKYVNLYLDEIISNFYNKKYDSMADKYLAYNNYIDRILSRVKELNKDDEMSKSELDHIIWYGSKGN